ncbi:MAG: glycosyltransferase family 2 protein [candidate division Zixibacteria bacterium]|nr:glycosyltransferase family 2 protein [candidate division Zixibacteria bacterium]
MSQSDLQRSSVESAGQRPKLRVVSCILCYNEARKIGPLIQRFMDPAVEAVVDTVLIIDDGSTDGSVEAINAVGNPRVVIISHGKNLGPGTAIRAGYNYAIKNGFDVFTLMAGNGKDDPHLIPALVAPILEDRADYVQGSRFAKGGLSRGLPPHRWIAMKLYTWTFSMALRKRLTDATNGFRAYRISLLKDPRIDWNQPWLGFSYEIEFYLLFKVNALKFRVAEVPVSKVYNFEKTESYTKVRPVDWLKNLKPLFLLWFGFRK